MIPKDDVARNAVKIAAFAAITWAAYKIIKGISQDHSPKQIVKETVTEPIKAVESVIKTTKTGLKHFVKGSQEAKEHMKKLASMRKPRTKKTKAEAGRIGGEATAQLGAHKGHKNKKGLVQDQQKVSKEKHETHYRKKRAVPKKEEVVVEENKKE